MSLRHTLCLVLVLALLLPLAGCTFVDPRPALGNESVEELRAQYPYRPNNDEAAPFSLYELLLNSDYGLYRVRVEKRVADSEESSGAAIDIRIEDVLVAPLRADAARMGQPLTLTPNTDDERSDIIQGKQYLLVLSYNKASGETLMHPQMIYYVTTQDYVMSGHYEKAYEIYSGMTLDGFKVNTQQLMRTLSADEITKQRSSYPIQLSGQNQAPSFAGAWEEGYGVYVGHIAQTAPNGNSFALRLTQIIAPAKSSDATLLLNDEIEILWDAGTLMPDQKYVLFINADKAVRPQEAYYITQEEFVLSCLNEEDGFNGLSLRALCNIINSEYASKGSSTQGE